MTYNQDHYMIISQDHLDKPSSFIHSQQLIDKSQVGITDITYLFKQTIKKIVYTTV